MQNVGKELPGLIKELLTAPAARQRALIEAHYTPGCRLTHALVMGASREDIIRIFQYWRLANRQLDVEVLETVVDAGGRKAWVQMVQRVTGFNHYTSPPLLGFSLPMSALLYLEDGPGGTKLIAKQVDLHQFEGILFCAPGLGWLMRNGLRAAASAWILGTARLAAATWPPAEAWLALTLGRRRLEAAKVWAARLWWRQAPPAAHGAPVPAPYDPRR